MKPCPLEIMSVRDILRFYEHVPILELDKNCWNWIYNKQQASRKPRPGFGVKNFNWSAARVMYSLFYGCVEKGLVIMHLCDNPLCVNPYHLMPGTNQENTYDFFFKKKNPTLEDFDTRWKKLKI